MTSNNTEHWIYERVLGSGGFGQVELWKEKYTYKKIAIKRCMLPNKGTTSRQKERWKQEIEIMEKFKHPNIVKAVKLPSEIKFDTPVLCMEYCNKGNLRKVLNESSNSCGLVEKEALLVMKDISSALKYLHQNNITHRDLKPENIVLHEKDGVIIYKLIDLGLAKTLGSNTETASLVGTFKYVAPELFISARYTCSVDYWSLGIIFFEVLTGYHPFSPNKQNFPKWVQCLENKKYEEICARDDKKGIQFYNDVIYPCDIKYNSECILNKLVEWFQIVLQWNSKTRGKRLNSNETVVFTFLREIFPKMTINIFSVPLYRMDQYHTHTSVTYSKLQKWIEQKTAIPANKQIIVDSNSHVLNCDDSEIILPNVPELVFYVYNTDSLEITKFDGAWSISEIFEIMLIDPDQIQDKLTLRQCYTELICIMRYEVNLFKHYVLAVGTKFDIVNNKLDDLNKYINKSWPKLDLLFNETEQSKKSELSSGVKDLASKIQNLHHMFDKIKSETTSFQSQMNEFFSSEKLLNSLQKYTNLYENFLNMFEEFENKFLRQHTKACSREFINDELDTLQNIYGEFEQEKETLLTDKDIVTVLRKIYNTEKNLPAYVKYIQSGIELLPLYDKQLHEALRETPQETPKYSQQIDESKNLISSDDIEIKNNIVLLTIFEKCIEESFSKIIFNLNST